MGVLDRTASAFLTVVHALSFLRPGGKRGDGQQTLNVTVHEGKVGRQSQSKYLVTLRVGKEKKETKKKKSDALLWEHGVQFSNWTPTDPLILKLRKAKRCKDATVAVLPIDVAAAMESVDGLPNRWWYAIDRIDKSGRQKEEAFLQITVTVDGLEGKRGSTQDQDPAKPAKETVQTATPGKPDSTPELNATSPPSAAGDIADVKPESSPTAGSTPSPTASFNTPGGQTGTRGDGEGDVKADPECPSSRDVEVSTGHNDSGRGQGQTGTRGDGEGDVKADPECPSSRIKVVDVSQTQVSIDVDSSTGDNIDSGRGQDPDKPGPTMKSDFMTAAQDTETVDVVPLSKDVEVEVAQVPTDGSESGRTPDPAKPAPSIETAMPAAQENPEALVEPKDVMSATWSRDEETDPDQPASSDLDTDRPEAASSAQGVPTGVDCSTGDNIDSGRGQDPVKPGPSMKTDFMTAAQDTETVDVVPLPKDVEVEAKVAQVPTDDSESGRTPDPAKPAPSMGTAMPAAQENPEAPVEPKDVMSATWSRDEETDPDQPASSDLDTDRPEAASSTQGVPTGVDCSTGDNIDSGRGQDPAKPGPTMKTDFMTAAQGRETVDVVPLSKDVEAEVAQVPTDGSESGRTPDPTKPGPSMETAMAAAQENPEVLVEPKDVMSATWFRDEETDQPANSDLDTDRAETTSSTQGVPTGGDNDSGRGQDLAKPGPTLKTDFMTAAQDRETVDVVPLSKDVEVEVAQVPTDGSESGRTPDPTKPASSIETAMAAAQENPEALVEPKDVMSATWSRDEETDQPANSDLDTDRPEAASSTQGGGVALPLTNPPPRHKDADDPQYEEMVWSIDDLWEDFNTKRQYADELLAYAESLRSKLAATVPHVLDYPIIKNLAAKVPTCKQYDLPDTEGMSLEDLQDVKGTLTKLVKDEEDRATYLRRWYIDDLCAVALQEAPEVLGASTGLI